MDKVWLSHYPADVPANIEPKRYRSLGDMFEQAVARYGDKTAFISLGHRLSFSELAVQSQAVAAYLQNELKLNKGDRVAIMMPNLLQYPVALFGILRAGMVAVNVNPLYTPRELVFQLKDSGARAIIVMSHFAHTVEQVLPETLLESIMVTRAGDLLPRFKGSLVNLAMKYLKKKEPLYDLPCAIPFRQVLVMGARHHFSRVELQSEDLALLQYTGGTSGTAKGAMLTHSNLLANLEQVRAAFLPVLTPGEECVVTALPLYHIFALTMNCLLFLETGGTNLLIADPRNIPALVKTLSGTPFSAITGVNTLFNALLNNPHFRRLDFSALRLSAGGGMPVQQVVAERWEQLTGCFLLEGYGLTECSPLVIANPHNTQQYTGSIGMPIPSTDVKIIDDQGLEVAVGELGELCVRGPQVMSGYWLQPEATAAVLINGWLHTGDIVKMDPSGNFRIVDRKKEIILVSGFNVYPNEIEDVVMQHPGVAEVAAIGVPAGAKGEAVKIFVVRKDPHLDSDSLEAFCRAQLTGYKVPRFIEFRDELPKSTVGKILRRALREASSEKHHSLH